MDEMMTATVKRYFQFRYGGAIPVEAWKMATGWYLRQHFQDVERAILFGKMYNGFYEDPAKHWLDVNTKYPYDFNTDTQPQQ